MESKSNLVEITLIDGQGKQFDKFTARIGTSLWFNIRKRGHPIGSSCSGVGVCVACVVTQISQSGLSHKGDLEIKNLAKISENNSFELGKQASSLLRISCLARVVENVIVQASYW